MTPLKRVLRHRLRSPNCVFWAIAVWLKRGGYLSVRKSITPFRVTVFGHAVFTGSIPHFLWESPIRHLPERVGGVPEECQHTASYVPRNRVASIGLREVPRVLWFDGKVTWGDHAVAGSFVRSGSKRFLLLRVGLLLAALVAIVVAGIVFWLLRFLRLLWWVWIEIL